MSRNFPGTHRHLCWSLDLLPSGSVASRESDLPRVHVLGPSAAFAAFFTASFTTFFRRKSHTSPAGPTTRLDLARAHHSDFACRIGHFLASRGVDSTVIPRHRGTLRLADACIEVKPRGKRSRLPLHSWNHSVVDRKKYSNASRLNATALKHAITPGTSASRCAARCLHVSRVGADPHSGH